MRTRDDLIFVLLILVMMMASGMGAYYFGLWWCGP